MYFYYGGCCQSVGLLRDCVIGVIFCRFLVLDFIGVCGGEIGLWIIFCEDMLVNDNVYYFCYFFIYFGEQVMICVFLMMYVSRCISYEGNYVVGVF